MAIKATLETSYGEERELYIRLNNIEASNHGVTSTAMFRGFLSEEAFNAGKQFLWEHTVEFTPDVSKPLWEQAYKALKAVLMQVPPPDVEPDPNDPPPVLSPRVTPGTKIADLK
jgi:hypothetical protein